MTDPSSDMELLRRWRAGDQESGTQLFRRHFASVFLFFQSKLNENVEDIAQQTFLACVEAGDRLDDVRSFKAYLFGIARNHLLRYLTDRGHAKRRQDLERVSAEEITGPSGMIAKQDEQRILLKGLRRIPLDLQIAVELFYWEQLPLVDIATVLGIPEGTVKSRLFRAKKLLRERIEALDATEALRRSTIQDLEIWARSLREKLADDA